MELPLVCRGGGQCGSRGGGGPRSGELKPYPVHCNNNIIMCAYIYFNTHILIRTVHTHGAHTSFTIRRGWCRQRHYGIWGGGGGGSVSAVSLPQGLPSSTPAPGSCVPIGRIDRIGKHFFQLLSQLFLQLRDLGINFLDRARHRVFGIAVLDRGLRLRFRV
eukprot:COSAG01_NODE_2552_length_7463_cov_644.066947_3_plen_161_part_00